MVATPPPKNEGGIAGLVSRLADRPEVREALQLLPKWIAFAVALAVFVWVLDFLTTRRPRAPVEGQLEAPSAESALPETCTPARREWMNNVSAHTVESWSPTSLSMYVKPFFGESWYSQREEFVETLVLCGERPPVFRILDAKTGRLVGGRLPVLGYWSRD